MFFLLKLNIPFGLSVETEKNQFSTQFVHQVSHIKMSATTPRPSRKGGKRSSSPAAASGVSVTSKRKKPPVTAVSYHRILKNSVVMILQ